MTNKVDQKRGEKKSIIHIRDTIFMWFDTQMPMFTGEMIKKNSFKKMEYKRFRENIHNSSLNIHKSSATLSLKI